MRLQVEIAHAQDLAMDVRFSLEGGLVALLGPSGSGKTRTLDTIAGLFRPTHAKVILNEDVLTDSARGVWVPPHRRHIGYVFQDSRLFPHLTVERNLLYGRHGRRTVPFDLVSMDDVIRLLDLAPLLRRHPATLSGGERRRVALGRALLSSPRLLLLDEPLGSLDVQKRQEILPYLDRLLADVRLPMVYVTHDWEEIRHRASAIVHIEHGHARAGT